MERNQPIEIVIKKTNPIFKYQDNTVNFRALEMFILEYCDQIFNNIEG